MEEALAGGATIVQLREKETVRTEELSAGGGPDKRELCHRYGVPLIINDNVEVAMKSGADGVHVGMEDMPVKDIRAMAGQDFIIGATAKTVEQAREAEAGRRGLSGCGSRVSLADQEERDPHYHRSSSARDLRRRLRFPWWPSAGLTRKISTSSPGGGMAGVAGGLRPGILNARAS